MSMAESWVQRFQNVRNTTMAICNPLSAEDCQAQSMESASPVKWHLAHTTWFFEYFVLEKFEENFKPHNSQFKFLYNSYYESLGSQFPRHKRGLITKPLLSEVKDYRKAVDDRVIRLLHENSGFDLLKILEIGLNHEQQHQELIVTDLKHLFFQNPAQPPPLNGWSLPKSTEVLEWLHINEGPAEIGHSGKTFFFDNEAPSHRQWIASHHIASRLVNNTEYLNFVNAGGYEKPEFWLSDGWRWINDNDIKAPLYWVKKQNEWCEFTFNGLQKLEPHAPVCHLSYYEADAYARSVGARLPTEFEWENFAKIFPATKDLFGSVWQWTSSSYSPYPGYRQDQGALGEYNGKFMVNQYVLRGSSRATPPDHSRVTYRNFFPAYTQWQLSGLRLAKN